MHISRTVRACALLVVVAIGGVACGKDSATSTTTTAKSKLACRSTTEPKKEAPVPDGADVAKVVAARKKPAVVIPTDLPKKLVVTDLIVGTGTPVAAGDKVTVQYVGVQASTCKEFDSSWSRGQPATFGLDEVIPGWTKGLVGLKPGGRRLLIIPADQAYGEKPTAGQPAGTLGFVIDLVSIAAAPKPDPTALDAATKRGKPTVTVPNPFPTKLVTNDLVVGTGTEVTASSTVLAHYVAVTASDGKVVDSSWEQNKPGSFILAQLSVPGLQQGFVGMKLGGRREIQIPSALAFGDKPTQQGAPAGPLVFVVDVVGVS